MHPTEIDHALDRGMVRAIASYVAGAAMCAVLVGWCATLFEYDGARTGMLAFLVCGIGGGTAFIAGYGRAAREIGRAAQSFTRVNRSSTNRSA
jgi:hypothetical protein